MGDEAVRGIRALGIHGRCDCGRNYSAGGYTGNGAVTGIRASGMHVVDAGMGYIGVVAAAGIRAMENTWTM